MNDIQKIAVAMIISMFIGMGCVILGYWIASIL